MRFKSVAALVVATSCALFTAACGSGGSASSGGVRVGYISFDESVPYVHSITQSLQTAAKKDGVKLVTCDAASDAETAYQCAVKFKQLQVQGIINYQSDAKAAARICAAGPDVPVIAITVPQEPCQDSFVGTDNAEAGQLAGKNVGDFFKSKFNCQYDAYISVEVLKTGQTGQDRMGGYRKGFESVCGKIHDLHIVDSQGVAETARAQVNDTLTALPKAHRVIIVGAADSLVLGALSAASTAGRLGDVYVSGQGLDSSGVCGMRKYSSHWIGDTAYFPESYGDVIIPAIKGAIEGKSLPKQLATKLEFITPATVDSHYKDVSC